MRAMGKINFPKNLRTYVQYWNKFRLSDFLLESGIQNLGSGSLDPGVHYQGPLPSPILMVQALCSVEYFFENSLNK